MQLLITVIRNRQPIRVVLPESHWLLAAIRVWLRGQSVPGPGEVRAGRGRGLCSYDISMRSEIMTS